MSEAAQSLLGSFDAGANEAGSDASGADASVETGVSGSAGESGAAKPADSARNSSTTDGEGGGSGNPDAKPDTSVKDDGKKQDTVPHAALHEARTEIKQLRAKITELEARPSLTTDQQSVLAKLKDAEQATQEAEPDFLADPKGYVDKKVDAALKKLEDTDKQSKETREQINQRQAIQDVLTATGQAEAAFKQTQADYPQALAHVRETRKSQLQMLYPQATEQQISQQINYEEITTAHQALTSGRNPAEFIYGYARTLGYQSPKPNGADKGGTADKKTVDKDAVRSMGSGGSGDAAPDQDAGNSTPEFSAALKERFTRKRA
jgi:hypothetical protein